MCVQENPQKKPQAKPHRQKNCLQTPKPDLTFYERRLYRDDISLVAGIDEAGRGCLAGPVVAASVILPQDISLEGIKDSKELTPIQRDNWFQIICNKAISWSFACVSAPEIDRINILNASLEAMKNSVSKLGVQPEYLLIDGMQFIESDIPGLAIKKGDSLSQSIAAASIVAKVTRDKMMVEFKKEYPKFSFDVHKGYGTALHLDEIKKHGPTPIHRMTFRGVK